MEIVIIGAGITGLATAYILTEQGVDVTIIEKGSNPGGLLSTISTGKGDNVECFYHHFFRQDTELAWLMRKLDLEEKRSFRTSSMGIYHCGILYSFNTLWDLLRFSAIGITDRIRFGLTTAMLTFLPQYPQMENMSALEWLNQWAGKAATKTVWQPLLRSKFGDVAEEIPLSWMAGRIRQRGRSRSEGDEHLGYITGSFQVLVDALVEKLKERGVNFQYECSVRSLVTKNGYLTGLDTSYGYYQASKVVATTPTPITAKIVKKVDPKYAAQLERIEYLGVICSLLSFSDSIMPYYWTNINDPDFHFGGIIEHTRLMPSEHYDGQHLVYLSKYLPITDPVWKLNDNELIVRQLNDLSLITDKNIRRNLNHFSVFRSQYAAPLICPEFSKLIPQICSPIPGLYVGSMVNVYPDERSTNNSILIASAITKSMGYTTKDFPQKTNSVAMT